ncbi:MAG: GAF domain-containing sensor histidine kinase [Bacteroidota bacterium]|nr:GAF domain-containing sensor histidine kinase [Bacteroidota bacterium]
MDKFHQLLEAAKLVNSTLELDRLLPIILSNAVNATNADRGTVFLIDETKQELWSKVFQGDELAEIRLPINSGIAGRVTETGTTINISDAYKDKRFNPEIDKQTGYTTKSILCMPLKNKNGKILGVFQLLNKKIGNFTEEDEDYINAFSIHASLAIENTNMAQQMVQSERLSTVGRMANTIIHDIKNPMATMRLYTQLLKNKVGNEEAAKMTDEIVRQIDRFVKMTQEILDFSRGVSATNFEATNVEQFINEVITFFEKDFTKRKISITKKINFDGIVKLDPDKMMRVIYNLAGNAADAMKDGGNFTITVCKENSFLTMAFTDTGTGMTEEVKSKIFEPFFTYGKKHGTGLGMAIVKKIIEDHHGTIEIDSEAGKGTTLKIKLPIV